MEDFKKYPSRATYTTKPCTPKILLSRSSGKSISVEKMLEGFAKADEAFGQIGRSDIRVDHSKIVRRGMGLGDGTFVREPAPGVASVSDQVGLRPAIAQMVAYLEATVGPRYAVKSLYAKLKAFQAFNEWWSGGSKPLAIFFPSAMQFALFNVHNLSGIYSKTRPVTPEDRPTFLGMVDYYLRRDHV